ncbi:hypothetical protein OQA88_708 [Cercophora sp. LCS_1]
MLDEKLALLEHSLKEENPPPPYSGAAKLKSAGVEKRGFWRSVRRIFTREKTPPPRTCPDGICTHTCPPGYHSVKGGPAESPWLGRLTISFEPEYELAEFLPWRESIDRCTIDEVTTVLHPILSSGLGALTFERRIALPHFRGDKNLAAVELVVWSEDSDWLVGLSRDELAALFNIESTNV